jgi:hypothetical protein
MRPQSKILKDEPNLSLVGSEKVRVCCGDLNAVEPHLTMIWPHEPSDEPQQCGFSATAWTENGDGFTTHNLE